MKVLKASGLAVLTPLILLASSSVASATTLTGPGGAETPIIHAVSEEAAVPGTKHIVTHNPIANVQCESTLEWQIESHGSGVTAAGKLTNLAVTPCTSGWVVHIITAGVFEAHSIGGNAATLTSSGMTVVKTRLGIECRYKTQNTDLGVLTGGNPATIHLNGLIPSHGGSGLCGASSHSATGAYITTGTVDVDA